ncbi:MAG: NlpC/P60 family protein [Proteobacteria bacterium]|nr:NlpC/P60 family protein [Pseudomonadota bacterium]
MLSEKLSPAGIPRGRIVASARGWIGTPYLHQASLRGVGCDCLGLLRGVWRDLFGAEPEAAPAYSPAWAELDASEPFLAAAHRHLVPVTQAASGSVVLFRWRPGASAKHCAILTGQGRMVHAHDGAGVAEVALLPAWRRRVVGVFDFPQVSEFSEGVD